MLIAGGGPAGSTLAWALARDGLRPVLLDRASFPREKVCGDFVDPRGLKVLRAMGALEALERQRRVKLTSTAAFVDWERCFNGPIPIYGTVDDVPSVRLHDPEDGARRRDAAGCRRGGRSRTRTDNDSRCRGGAGRRRGQRHTRAAHGALPREADRRCGWGELGGCTQPGSLDGRPPPYRCGPPCLRGDRRVRV